ncbi:MAG TPA: DUF262 domain-containing protein [Thermoanaerobaculia bacterium]|jgi:hypothetical protein|nr:DUF262 domain-containing protein [Thermoanaerobaculia bacterium]
MATDKEEETPEITPQVVHLIDLLKWAREGRLRVPKFQRDFVWRRQDIVDLFDSISKQYPIGTMFLWGADPMPEHRDHIGPLGLPDYKGQTWLVLDGQQRLTTLVGVLLFGEPQWNKKLDSEDPGRWEIYFDAKPDGGFTHAPRSEPLPSSYIAAPALLDTMKLFNEANRITKVENAETAELWVNRAQQAARAIQGYRVPIVQFTTNNLSIAVESFSRLNKKGRSIGQDEMFSALTYEETGGGRFHLAGEIDRLQQSMVRSGFGEVGRTILLRAVLTAAGLDMYRTDWSRLGEQVKTDTRQRLPDAVTEAERGLNEARAFLRGLGVLNARMLPYSMQLVSLGAFFGRCSEPTNEQKTLLRRWFWSSSFAGWFGTGNPTRVRRLVEELRDRLPKEKSPANLEHMDLGQPALPTPLRFDLRSARVRALVCVLLRREPKRPDGTPLALAEAAQLLFERGPGAMSVVCATVRDSDLRKSPANRILDVAPDVPGQAKNWLLKLDPSFRGGVLESHAIPLDSFDLIQSGDNDAFLQRRMEFLGQLEREFMQQVQVTFPASNEPALSPLDTDDELALAPPDEQ